MIFGMLGKKPARAKPVGHANRFTRFADTRALSAVSPDGNKKFSRFAPQETATAPKKVTRAHQTQATHRTVAPTVVVKLNPAEHLDSEARIPVSILRKALPKRFSEMPEESRIANLS